MARNPPLEEMMSRTIYGPKRLLAIDNLSEVVIGLLEQNSPAKKPEDSRLKTYQSLISDVVNEDPRIARIFSRDDVEGEAIIRARLTLKQIDATEQAISASEISAIMTQQQQQQRGKVGS